MKAPAPREDRKANRRGAARLAAVQALYQMDIAGTKLQDILAEFESHWIGREVDGSQYLPAEAAFFRSVVQGVLDDQRALDPMIDAALQGGWPLKRVEALLRAVLRAGAFELSARKDVPARVVVTEYVDVANAFLDKDETGMVNAVLDQLARQLRADEFGRAAGSAVAHDQDGSAEDRLIARYFRPLAKHPGAFGFTDDAAAITPPAGHDLVLNSDGLIAGVHFFPDDPPDGVACKALRVNLSDLAAKGAAPLGFLLAIALPKDFSEDWLAAFTRGLSEDCDAYDCPLLGGDTDSTPGPVSISIAAFGTLPQGTMVRRAGAKAGDHVFVSGTIGDAALGLRLRREPGLAQAWTLDTGMAEHLIARYRVPQPRNALAQAVRTHASAAIDVSDGLAADLAKLCRVSQVSADVEAARVPLSPAATQALGADGALIDTVLTGGEDYEILCTVAPQSVAAFRADAAAAGVAVSEIGRIVAGSAPPRFLDRAGVSFARPGYSHF